MIKNLPKPCFYGLIGKKNIDQPTAFLPMDATLLTPCQRETVVDYLVTLPLEELRKRQTDIERDLQIAFERKLDTLESLQVKQELLRAAVEKKEFPA